MELSALCDPTSMRDLLSRHEIRLSHALGQNFLREEHIVRAIVRGAGVDESVGVLEIGPGAGVLTRALAETAGRVVSLELDARLLPVLAETVGDCPQVTVLHTDALKADFDALMDTYFQGLTPIVCANLPYQITTPILTKLLSRNRFARITVMVQREVARRICAAPDTPDYGAFSIFCQAHAAPRILFDVPPHCFVPPPKVTSSVVRLDAAPAELPDREFFFRVTRAAFGQRRKTLLNALGALGLPRETVAEALARAGIAPSARGETLGIPEFARLTAALKTPVK